MIEMSTGSKQQGSERWFPVQGRAASVNQRSPKQSPSASSSPSSGSGGSPSSSPNRQQSSRSRYRRARAGRSTVDSTGGDGAQGERASSPKISPFSSETSSYYGRPPASAPAGVSRPTRAGGAQMVASMASPMAVQRAQTRAGFGGGFRPQTTGARYRSRVRFETSSYGLGSQGSVYGPYDESSRRFGSGTCGGLYDPVHRDFSNGPFGGNYGTSTAISNNSVFVPPSGASASCYSRMSAGDMSQSNASSPGNPLATNRQMCQMRR